MILVDKSQFCPLSGTYSEVRLNLGPLPVVRPSVICRCLDLRRSCYYDWCRNIVQNEGKDNKILAQNIHNIFAVSPQTYGTG